MACTITHFESWHLNSFTNFSCLALMYYLVPKGVLKEISKKRLALITGAGDIYCIAFFDGNV